MNWSKIKNKVFLEKVAELDTLFTEVSNNISNIKVSRSNWTKPIENWTAKQITCSNSLKLNLEEYNCIKNIIDKINEDLIYSDNTFEEHKNKFKQSYFEMLCGKEENLKLEIVSELVEEKKLPLEIFLDWYLLNCQLPPEKFNESLGEFWGNVWKNAKKGAAYGALGGSPGGFAGTGLGAGLGGVAGGLYGGGKHLLKKVWDWHKGKSEFERTKEQALDALKKLKDKSNQFDLGNNFKTMLDSMIEILGTTKAHKVNKPVQPFSHIRPIQPAQDLPPIPLAGGPDRPSRLPQNIGLKPLDPNYVSKRKSPDMAIDSPVNTPAPQPEAPVVMPEAPPVKPKRTISPEHKERMQAGRLAKRLEKEKAAAAVAQTADTTSPLSSPVEVPSNIVPTADTAKPLPKIEKPSVHDEIPAGDADKTALDMLAKASGKAPPTNEPKKSDFGNWKSKKEMFNYYNKDKQVTKKREDYTLLGNVLKDILEQEFQDQMITTGNIAMDMDQFNDLPEDEKKKEFDKIGIGQINHHINSIKNKEFDFEPVTAHLAKSYVNYLKNH